jgi:hypothetical protein
MTVISFALNAYRLRRHCTRRATRIGEEMTNLLPGITLVASAALGGIPLAEMEKAYWDCEFAAEQGILDSSDAGNCSEVYERLNAEKFDNNFQRFLEWWKANKGREYAARVESHRYQRNRSNSH